MAASGAGEAGEAGGTMVCAADPPFTSIAPHALHLPASTLLLPRAPCSTMARGKGARAKVSLPDTRRASFSAL